STWSQSITVSERVDGYLTASGVTLSLYIHSGSASGPVLSGVLVTGTDGAGQAFNQTTGSAGYVTITGAPGTWYFTASEAGYATSTWSQSITVSERVDAYLTGLGVALTLYIHSGSASGPVLSGALVTGTDGAGQAFSQTTGSGGYVTITGAPGTWQLTASDAGYTTRTWSQSITVTERVDGYLTTSPLTLTLYVRSGSASGPVLSGALVTGSDGAGQSFSQTTGGAGYVTITGTPGTWQFTASKAGYSLKSWSQSITATETLNVYLTATVVPVTLTLNVHSGSASGPLLSGVLVTGSDGAGQSFNQTTGAGGYVTITGARGTWQFTASKAGYNANSWNQSMTATETLNAYLTATVVQAPVFSPPAGYFSAAVTVRASTATSGAIIRYTENGSDPTSSSPLFPSSGLTLTSTTTLNARAFKTGMADSAVTTGTYTINIAQVAPPTFSPSPGNYNNVQNVTISTTTSGATIRYTINGTDPTTSSSLYTRPVNISSTTTLRARAFKTSMTESLVTTGTYTIQLPSIVLLLHGMNSDPDTWTDFIDDHNYFPGYVPPEEGTVPTAPII